MKKICCLMLAVISVFSIASCGGTSNSENEDNTLKTEKRPLVTSVESVTDLAKEGQMDCTEIELGDIIDEIYKEYPTQPSEAIATEQKDDEIYLNVTVGTNLTRFSYSDLQFFTVNGKDSKGVGIMVTSNGAYGFKCNLNLKEDITNVLGEPDFSSVLPEDERFYMLGSEEAYRLTYIYGNYRLDFITVDDILSFIVLSDTEIYNGFSVSGEANND